MRAGRTLRTLSHALAAIGCLSIVTLLPEAALAQFAKPPSCTPIDKNTCIAQNEACTGTSVTPNPCPGPLKPLLPPAMPTLAISDNGTGRYFNSFTNSTTIPLLGLSFDYTCHICQPQNSDTCNLGNFQKIFGDSAPLNDNLNSVLRLTTIFNSSPGATACGCCYTNAGSTVMLRGPFQHEEVYRLSGTRWNLSLYDKTYLDYLDGVVGAASAPHINIVVEVTLFDPWDKNWSDSPFNQTRTVNPPKSCQDPHPPAFPTCQKFGFTQPYYFVSEKNDCVGGTGPNHCMGGTKTQDGFTRDAQKSGACKIVARLSKYPNVIFEIANEPDLPQAPSTSVAESDIVAWEEDIINYLRTTPACNLGKHLIQMNGHHLDTTVAQGQGTFGWWQGTGPLGTGADVASAHYAFFTPDKTELQSDWTDIPTFYGALEQVQPFAVQYPKPALTASEGAGTKPMAFNEGLGLPDTQYPLTDPGRTDEEVRSEALEFITSGGALFDGYSTKYLSSSPLKLIGELKKTLNVLIPGPAGLAWLDGMTTQGSCCRDLTSCPKSATGPWCWNVQQYGTGDPGACPVTTPPTNIYWSTIANTGQYQGLTAADAILYVHHGTVNFFQKKPGVRPQPQWAGGYTATPCPTASGGYNVNWLQYTAPGQVTGCYSEIWIDPRSGTLLNPTPASVYLQMGALPVPISYRPVFDQDVLLLLKYQGRATPAKTCPPAPSMTSAFTITCNYLSCTFDGSSSNSAPPLSITSYGWGWGDTTSSNTTSSGTVHNFTAPGHYIVSLTVSDASGNSSVVGQQLTVTSRPPTPSFTVSCNQMSCTFNGSGSTAGPNAQITGYLWSFGDANFANGAAVTTNAYAAGGVYDVSLTLTDAFGVLATTTQTITVAGPPDVRFTAICAGSTCVFDGSATTGDSAITSYNWAFGDGNSGTGVNPTNNYNNTGTYSVTLTATDANGQPGSLTDSVDVYAAPTTSFTFSCPNSMTCSFYSATNDALQVATWTWDFGDGTVVTNPSLTQSGQPELAWQPQYTYAASGLYTVTVTVTDTAGNTASIAQAVLANIAPVAVNDTATTWRDLPVIIYVLANDSDADGDPLSIASVNMQNYPGASWQVVPNGSSWALKVTPPDNFVGTMTFTYVAADRWGATATATVTLTVNQTAHVLNALDQQFWCQQNGSIRIGKSALLAVAYDSTPNVTLGIVGFDTSVLSGTLVCDSTACTFTPPTNAYGVTLFRYTVGELPPAAGYQDTGTVRIYVGSYGQAPTANDVYFTTTRNTPKVFTIQDVVQNDVDPDGDTLSMALQSGPTAFGSLNCTTPMYSCTYTPNPGFVGTDRFLYSASDGIYAPVTAMINILTLPPATPTFDAREDVIVTGVNQSTYFSNARLTNTAYAPSGGPMTVTAIDTTGLVGSLSCDSFGCTYSPNYSFQGATTFKYTANDGHGATDTAIVKIKVGITNNPPVAVPLRLSTPQNNALRFSVFDLMQHAYDPDDDPLDVSVYTFTAHLGTLSCGTPNYWCTYTPNANTAGGADAITYLLSDGTTSVTSTVTITITQ